MRIDLIQEAGALYQAAKAAGDEEAGTPSVHYVVEGNAKLLSVLVEELAEIREELRLLSPARPDPLPTPSKDENAA